MDGPIVVAQMDIYLDKESRKMGKFEKKMIELGSIDTPIERFGIDEWFENVTIAFQGKENIGNVVCIFKQCYEVSLKHDVTYDKGKIEWETGKI